MAKDNFIKYGGAKFTNNASPSEINRFVRELPEDKRDSMSEVVEELDNAGLIELDDSELFTVDPTPPDEC